MNHDSKPIPQTRIRRLLERLLRIVGESTDYFVSGSLSFIPLVPAYREPEHDVDASLSGPLFRSRREMVATEGQIQVLRFGEVAVAQDLPISRFLSPRTDFMHVNTPDGLLDLTIYNVTSRSLVFRLGAGLTLEVPRCVLDRVTILTWSDLRYRAGPPELAFLPKAVWYLRTPPSRLAEDRMSVKHLQDLKHLHSIIDWRFLAQLVQDGAIRCCGLRLPGLVDRRVNPFNGLDVGNLRRRLEMAALPLLDPSRPRRGI